MRRRWARRQRSRTERQASRIRKHPVSWSARGSHQLVPVVTGSLSGFTVEPPSPAGLMIAESTGGIFGIPAAVAPTTTYTVQARGGDRVAARLRLPCAKVLFRQSYAVTSWDLVARHVPANASRPASGSGAVSTCVNRSPSALGLLFDLAKQARSARIADAKLHRGLLRSRRA